ncbi:hypothetical protein [Flavobacterium panici]|uniref:Uncharacterized protein n=1 Tax=Flavobacterium panici TaxID=2654843 RepID=A0A9N8J5Y2_9FLAO|nr:hypothetical protein [Flavobacterium panici]CAC9976956.1 hypothetical protein FLAPXU55_04687 [Flavobacterium panici]
MKSHIYVTPLGKRYELLIFTAHISSIIATKVDGIEHTIITMNNGDNFTVTDPYEKVENKLEL